MKVISLKGSKQAMMKFWEMYRMDRVVEVEGMDREKVEVWIKEKVGG